MIPRRNRFWGVVHRVGTVDDGGGLADPIIDITDPGPTPQPNPEPTVDPWAILQPAQDAYDAAVVAYQNNAVPWGDWEPDLVAYSLSELQTASSWLEAGRAAARAGDIAGLANIVQTITEACVNSRNASSLASVQGPLDKAKAASSTGGGASGGDDAQLHVRQEAEAMARFRVTLEVFLFNGGRINNDGTLDGTYYVPAQDTTILGGGGDHPHDITGNLDTQYVDPKAHTEEPTGKTPPSGGSLPPTKKPTSGVGAILVGAGGGFLIGGPIGAVIGAVAGAMLKK